MLGGKLVMWVYIFALSWCPERRHGVACGVAIAGIIKASTIIYMFDFSMF